MGWLFTLGQSKKDLVARRTKAWDHDTPDGAVISSACLRHCYRGNSFTGVLWTVWQRTFVKDSQPVKPAERWIACDLLQYQTGYGWGYKDMDESVLPRRLGATLRSPHICKFEKNHNRITAT
jgi:hypothetical protein